MAGKPWLAYLPGPSAPTCHCHKSSDIACYRKAFIPVIPVLQESAVELRLRFTILQRWIWTEDPFLHLKAISVGLADQPKLQNIGYYFVNLHQKLQLHTFQTIDDSLVLFNCQLFFKRKKAADKFLLISASHPKTGYSAIL